MPEPSPKSQWNTKWCKAEEIPPVGIQCPSCGKGYLSRSKFNETDVYCSTCKTAWKLSGQDSRVFEAEKPLTKAPLLEEIKAIVTRIEQKIDFLVPKSSPQKEALKQGMSWGEAQRS